MRSDPWKSQGVQVRRRKTKQPFILTLNDLDKTNVKHNLLIAEFQTRFQAARERAKDQPLPKPK